MTTPTAHRTHQFAAAGLFLEQLATGDFSRLGLAFEEDATLRALLPNRVKEWGGRDGVRAAFEMFFRQLDQFEILDAEVGQVGSRMQLRWRVRVRGVERFGDGDFVVEQFCYADGGPTGRILSMSLICSGFCRERTDG
jgi:hypothetical protein